MTQPIGRQQITGPTRVVRPNRGPDSTPAADHEEWEHSRKVSSESIKKLMDGRRKK